MQNHLNIYIVEDEPLIVATIETALLKQGFNVIGDAEDAQTALKEIEELKPNLVLLDIQLEGQSDGVTLAEALDKIAQPYMYLTSQTDPNTINRVKQTSPLGYIVKPFTESGLRSNIELAWYNYKTENSHYLVIKSEGKTYKLNQNNITHLKAFDNYCYIYTIRRSYIVPHTLKHITEELNEDIFIKTHRSFWVNVNHVEAIEKNNLILKTEPIPLSASQKQLVIDKIKGH